MQASRAARSVESGKPERPLTIEVGSYLALAFGLSWVLLIGAIKLGLGEEYLNIGVAGPALAALILSRRSRQGNTGHSFVRGWWFLGLLALCWILISLNYLWRSSEGLEFHLRLALLVPAAVPAWILSGIVSSDDGVRALVRRMLHVPNRWSLFALLCLPLLLGVPSLIAHELGAPLVSPEPRNSAAASIASATIFFLFNLLFVGVEEEPGWRGFLVDRLQQKFSPLLTSLLVWLPWALWHAPLDYYRPVRFTWVSYVLLRVVFLIPLTILLTWLYNRSNRSIQAAAIFHACMNTVPFVMPYYQPAWILLFVFMGYAIISDKMWRHLSSCTPSKGAAVTV